jgi:predicted nucleotidyltransferase
MLKLYQKIFEEFRKVKGNGKIIAFGSVVKGKSRFDSDIDIAVITSDKKFLSKVEEISDKILFKYGKVVSIIKFSEKEFETGKEPIIKEIKKGMIIYGGS